MALNIVIEECDKSQTSAHYEKRLLTDRRPLELFFLFHRGNIVSGWLLFLEEVFIFRHIGGYLWMLGLNGPLYEANQALLWLQSECKYTSMA